MRRKISFGCARPAQPATPLPDMTAHRERVVVSHTPQQMYDLVADVARYPEFLPWCIGARILRRDGNVLFAELVIGWKVLRERFSSKVVLDAPNRVQFDYTNGPLKYLHGDWRFSAAPQGGTLVEFQVDFEFRSRALSLVMGGVFTELVHRMVGAYKARADQLYGQSRAGSLQAGEPLEQEI
jgi:coenzyme Q-binding protein COQ10